MAQLGVVLLVFAHHPVSDMLAKWPVFAPQEGRPELTIYSPLLDCHM